MSLLKYEICFAFGKMCWLNKTMQILQRGGLKSLGVSKSLGLKSLDVSKSPPQREGIQLQLLTRLPACQT